MSHPTLAPGQTLEQKIQSDLNHALAEAVWEAAWRADPEAAWRTLEANLNAALRDSVARCVARAAAAPATDVAGLTALALGVAALASRFADAFRVVAALPVADRFAAWSSTMSADPFLGVVTAATAGDAAGALSAAAHSSWEQSVKVLASRLSEDACPPDKTSVANQFSKSEEAEVSQGPEAAATTLPDLLSAPDLARYLNANPSRIETFLRRHREKYTDCFCEVEGRRVNQAKYLYRVREVISPLRQAIAKGRHLTDG